MNTTEDDRPLGLSSTAGLGPPPQLLACPFCGAQTQITWRRSNPKSLCVTADCWGAKLPTVALDDPHQVEAWNKRA